MPLGIEIALLSTGGGCTLGHDHDAEVATVSFPLADLVAHATDVERDFGHENDIGGAGDPRIQGDEAGSASHHLDHHHSLVALGRRVELVDGVGGSGHRRVEPEGGDGAAHVVVNRLGDADDRDALGYETAGDFEGAVAADDDEGIQLERPERRDQLIGAVPLAPTAVGPLFPPIEGIAAVGGAEDGAARVGDAPDLARAQWDEQILTQQAAEAAAHSDALPSPVDGREHCSANDRVQARRVPTTRRNGNLHDPAPASRSRRTTSSGSAWRFNAFFEKIRRPSASTSNTPPEDSISLISAPGKDRRISAARPAARGS